MRVLTTTLLLVLLAATTGCALNAQTVKLDPDVSSPEMHADRNVAVQVKVVDQRPDQTIGHRRAGLYGDGAAIDTNQNVADVVQGKIVRGLEKQGFRSAPASGNAKNSLTVEVRDLDYSSSVGLLTGGIHAGAALNAIARHGNGVYQHFYHAAAEDRTMFTATAGLNSDLINSALSKALTQLLNDSQLIQFLSQRP